MKTVTVTESSMTFGRYNPSQLFQIEKSVLYKNIGKNVKAVEFMYFDAKGRLVLVEAKSSSPQPGNGENFDAFISEIFNKFTHSVNMLFALLTGILKDKWDELPNYFREVDYSGIEIRLYLIICGHKEEWLAPINAALQQKFAPYEKIWKAKFIAINDNTAFIENLIIENSNK